MALASRAAASFASERHAAFKTRYSSRAPDCRVPTSLSGRKMTSRVVWNAISALVVSSTLILALREPLAV